MKTRFVVTSAFVLILVGMVAPLYAQGAEPTASPELVKWSLLTGGFALALAACVGALSQAKGLSAASEGIARNPSAAGDIRGLTILGLVLIESLVIYVLLISLILFFIKPFGG